MRSKAPATEVTSMPLKEGTDVNDISSPAHEIWQYALATVAKQPGFKYQYYGYQLEDPKVLQHVIDWETIDSHQKFIASPVYGPFVEKLGPILSDAPHLFHFFPKPYPPAILGTAPCIEVATFYHTETYFIDNVEKFMQTTKLAEGYYGHAVGEVAEQIEQEEGKGKGKAVLLCIGWESKEAHLKYRETEAFTKTVHLLREGMGGVGMKHVHFKKY